MGQQDGKRMGYRRKTGGEHGRYRVAPVHVAQLLCFWTILKRCLLFCVFLITKGVLKVSSTEMHHTEIGFSCDTISGWRGNL